MVEITRLEPKEKKGLVVVITGHGKGKTTTALGIAVRACGHDMKVSIIQFMKEDLYAALHLKLVDLDQVLQIIEQKPSQIHLVLTGRNAHPRVIELADTVSEITEVKHAYRKGIEPQPGIDY